MAFERAHSLIDQVLEAVASSDDEPAAVDAPAELAAPDASGRSWGARLRRMLLVGALVAVAAGVSRWMRGTQADNWQSAYVPAPPPSAPSGPDPADAAGAGPGEAVADATAVPHAVTTPDSPAEVVEVVEVSEEK